MRTRFILNNRTVVSESSADTTLLHALRDEFHCTGVNCGCEAGECGACSVLIEEECIPSCMVLIGEVEGKTVTTIEGLSKAGSLSIVQEAFVEAGAIQCGFCTPGMVIAAEALLRKNRRPSREEIQKALSGNICRCTGYEQIIEAVQLASRRMCVDE